MYFVEPIRDRKKIAQIKNQLRGQRRYRDLLLFVIGINSILRISDLLQSDHPPTYQARQTGRKTAVQRQKVEELYLAIRSGERR